MRPVGCHLSFSGGFQALSKRMEEVNADTAQMFIRNPRGGAALTFGEEDPAFFRSYMKEHRIPVFLVHAPYTLNPCSDKESVREFARMAMRDDLVRLKAFDNVLYNFHPGSHVGKGTDRGIEDIIGFINEIVDPDITATVLLETMSGKGSEVGGTFEQLRKIIDGVRYKEKIGVCFDTCHVWDAGYDIRNDLKSVLDEFDRVIGISRLKALHLNDSKNPCGSHKDRHEKLGQGYLGYETFENILKEPRLKEIPAYLETPWDSLDGYRQEIAWLRSHENS
ncbi:MAG: deoxyribonuclease IV [Erysipelotrichales bacterium]|nr:deoxyribonuclease IV [Erysipelotrichales bacterium]